jgi:uncharacterized protein YbjT (DUF2867 family)
MKVVLFGGTGMVGQGILRECVASADVERVLVVVRRPSGLMGKKVEELVHDDFFSWPDAEQTFAGYDTCFFCLGMTAVGTPPEEYRRVMVDMTVGVGKMLTGVSSMRNFIYVSARGTSANSRQRWARTRAETETALMVMPFAQVYCLRPGYIQPMHGLRSKVGWYNAVYAVTGWMYPFWRRLLPFMFTSTEEMAQAMLKLAQRGYPKKVLETSDIHKVVDGCAC